MNFGFIIGMLRAGMSSASPRGGPGPNLVRLGVPAEGGHGVLPAGRGI